MALDPRDTTLLCLLLLNTLALIVTRHVSNSFSDCQEILSVFISCWTPIQVFVFVISNKFDLQWLFFGHLGASGHLLLYRYCTVGFAFLL